MSGLASAPPDEEHEALGAVLRTGCPWRFWPSALVCDTVAGEDAHQNERGPWGECTDIELSSPTASGDTHIALWRHRPQDIGAATIERRYRKRWRIEAMFQRLTQPHLQPRCAQTTGHSNTSTATLAVLCTTMPIHALR